MPSYDVLQCTVQTLLHFLSVALVLSFLFKIINEEKSLDFLLMDANHLKVTVFGLIESMFLTVAASILFNSYTQLFDL